MENIGKKIKDERKAKKLTQSQLATQLGITQDSISLWEMGKRIPDTQYIILLCKILDVSADYLLGIEDTCGTKTNSKYNIGTINNNGNINIK